MPVKLTVPVHRDPTDLLETLDHKVLLVPPDLMVPRDEGEPRDRLDRLEISDQLATLVFQ